jgi:hypothetical protein
MKAITTLLAAVMLTGCAVGPNFPTSCGRDHRDRPWDPCPGRALFEQIPNWQPGVSIEHAGQGPAAGDIVIINR